MPLGPEQVTLKCPHCHAVILTRIDKQSTTNTHYLACLFCLVCCPLVICPYIFSCCFITDHFCPECNKLLGTFAE